MIFSEFIQKQHPEVYKQQPYKIERISDALEEAKRNYSTLVLENYRNSLRNLIHEFELINKKEKQNRAKEIFESIYYRDGNNVLDDENVQLIVEAMIRFEESESTNLPIS
ncbi:hypothetical protein [Draconibacterium sp.]|uniref:hypothetical protein n=1 Tax=Draconibacterium sp. TaxID=1965318 RepID=UPI0035617BDF